jgi:hypothetical protein
VAAFTHSNPARRAARRLLAAGPAVGAYWGTALIINQAWAWPVPVIAAWPSFALIAAYELLMRQVRQSAAARGKARLGRPAPWISRREGLDGNVQRPRRRRSEPSPPGEASGGRSGASGDLRWQAWQWALANRAGDGSLPSGREIARQYGRHERWGRLVKHAGAAGQLAHAGGPSEPGLRLVGQRPSPATRG